MSTKQRLCAWLVVPLVAVASLGAADSNALVSAAKQGDRTALRTLLRERVDVNAAEPDGMTALHWAVHRNDVEAVDLLIQAKANVNAANRYGVTAMAVACTNGNAAIVERLLRAGVDPNSASPEGETALMTAARTGSVEAVKTLLINGADVNAKEQWRNQTALMWAAAENHAAVVTSLIEARADIATRTNGGFDAMMFAVRAGSIDAVKALLDAGASANDTLLAGAPAGRPMAAAAPRPAAGSRPQGTPGPQVDNGVAQLLQVYNTGSRGRSGAGGTSALVLAITNAHFELASVLLERGADPNADAQGWTALHQLAWTRRPPIQHGLPPAVQTGNLGSLELAKQLLAKGANPNSRMTKEPSDGARNILNRIGSTAFLQAAKLGDVEYMRLLLAHGADPSITTEEGATPLMAAAGVGIWQIGESAGSNEEVFEAVKICYERGNDVNAVDVNGETALHGAAHRGSNEIVKFLVEKGAKMDLPNKLGWTPWIIADGVFYPNTYNRRLDTAELLLKLGANPKVGKRRPEDLPPSEAIAPVAPQQP